MDALTKEVIELETCARCKCLEECDNPKGICHIKDKKLREYMNHSVRKGK